MKYDYAKDIMVIDGVKYDLKPFRMWLLLKHADLVGSHIIKRIRVGYSMVNTYDWQQIYFIASELLITKQYTDEINPTSTGSVSDRQQGGEEG